MNVRELYKEIINILPLAGLIASIALASGIIYVFLNINNRSVVEYPLSLDVSSQSIIETILIGIGYLGAAGGLILIYRSLSRPIRRFSSTTQLSLILGVATLFLAFILLEIILAVKK